MSIESRNTRVQSVLMNSTTRVEDCLTQDGIIPIGGASGAALPYHVHQKSNY